MKNYEKIPVYFNKAQQAKIFELLDRVKLMIAKGNQDTDYLVRFIYAEVKEIQPRITQVFCNYYNCDGKLAFAIKVGSKYSDVINFDLEIVKGWVIGAPNGHLSRYYKVRW
jgi:aconitase B